MSSQEERNKRIQNVYNQIEITRKSLDRITEMLRSLEKDELKDLYKDIPGVTGVFDGSHMVAEDGTKVEVPANYAAKSRLVFGDSLKLIEEDGKQVFKQIEKVDRRKVEGVLTKKEGKWYIISDSGTFKVSDSATDFQLAELNDEAVAFIPADNLNAPFAALDKINKKTSVIQHAAAVSSQPVQKVSVEPKRAPTTAQATHNSRPVRPAPAGSALGKPRSTFKPKPRKDKVEELTVSTEQTPLATTKSIRLDEDDLR